jgi:hypothetical protein
LKRKQELNFSEKNKDEILGAGLSFYISPLTERNINSVALVSWPRKRKEVKTTMATRRGSFKGKPTLSLLKREDDKFPFTFGRAKARLIVENIADITAFANEGDDEGNEDEE